MTARERFKRADEYINTHYKEDSNLTIFFNNVVKDINKLIKKAYIAGGIVERESSNWIDVNASLPERKTYKDLNLETKDSIFSETVLVTDGINIYLGSYDYDVNTWWIHNYDIEDNPITHWCKLPKLPNTHSNG